MIKPIKNSKLLLLAFFLSGLSFLNGQSISELYNRFGEVIVTKLSNAPFPHVKRLNGHTYNNTEYPFEKYYNDSSVIIFVPQGYHPKNKNDFVIHFHGWYNNVDSVLSQLKLIEQFCKSGKNAILIIPQGPKNSPDSFDGKLEEKNYLRNFMREIVDLLYQKKIKA